VNLRFPIEFDRPQYLALLAVLPPAWWLARRTTSAMGPWRGAVVFGFRAVVWMLIVAACAEMQWVRTDGRLSVVYLLDRSLSIPESQRRAMVDYVNRTTAAHRPADDLAGAVAFGRRAAVELPPFDDDLQLASSPSVAVDGRYTNLAEAVRLAAASFPPDTAKRIVVISDGNQNLGDAYAAARQAADRGIGIDVVPVVYRTPADVAVERVSLPAVVRRGEPFDVQVLLHHMAASDRDVEPSASADDIESISGTLELLRRRGDETRVLSRERVSLASGRRTFVVRQTLEESDFYEYEARFTSDLPQGDARPQNNRSTNFTQVEGAGRVLFVENYEKPGTHARLVAALREAKLEVTLLPSNRLFSSAAELIPYDAVVLADVPRTSGDGAADVGGFTDEQIDLLTTSVRELGSGLVILGGSNAFGAGGWASTSLEAAMPVDFQVKNVEVVPSGALMLVLDKSGSMLGEKIEMCKTAAVAAVKVLGARDYAGVVAFDSEPHWIVPMHRLRSSADVTVSVQRLAAGGGTNLEPALKAAYEAIADVPAGVKHVVVLTDGHTFGGNFEKLAADMRKQGVTTSAVALGSDAALPLLDELARTGGGKFYAVTDARTIPRIFVNEARRVARPLIFEDERGFVPEVVAVHEALRPLAPPAAPLTGFVMTGRKSSPLVQTLLVDPRFSQEGTGTIAAVWTYGLGRTAVWTSDAGQAWARGWNDRPDFDAMLSGLIRWTMRPPSSDGERFVMRADVVDGRGQVSLTGFDEQGDFLSRLDPQGTVVGPDLQSRPLRLEQTAPGRYAATFAADDVGSYFLVVRPATGQPVLRTGVSVAYSGEFRDRETNTSLLTSLAALEPQVGLAGRMTSPLSSETPDLATSAMSSDATPNAAVDFFRHDLTDVRGRRDLWPDLTLAAVTLFVGDVFVRRVALPWQRWAAMLAGFAAFRRRRTPTAATSDYIERLRNRKAEATADATRSPAWQPTVDAAANEAQPTATTATATQSTVDPTGDYTARLLRAKRRMREERRDDDGDDLRNLKRKDS